MEYCIAACRENQVTIRIMYSLVFFIMDQIRMAV